MNKNLLLIFRHPPFANSSNAEALDIAFACAAFDLPVSLLFINDGILQLVANQQSDLLSKKDLTKNFRALSMYDVEDYFVIEEDVANYQLTQDQLILKCNIINKDKMASLIRTFDTVINL